MHLSLAKWADAILISPASADFIAKLRNGIAGSLAYTTLLAFNFKGPVNIAPAMNSAMFNNPITQDNILFLKNNGVYFIGPKVGQLADGTIGKGRLANISEIVQRTVFKLEEESAFKNKNFVITAGATLEYIDPVRFITNGSTGKMGAEIAVQAKLKGAHVHLISGKVKTELPYVDQISYVTTTEELLKVTKSAFKESDILIMAAAPVDFKTKEPGKKKIKKMSTFNLPLVSAPDVIKSIKNYKGRRVIVGFALQTEDLEKNALKKMKEKGMDIVVANNEKNIGADKASAILMDKYGRKKRIVRKDKKEIAKQILEFLEEYIDREAKNG